MGALFGVSIFIGWFDPTDSGIHKAHNTAYSSLFFAIVTVGFLVQNWRPETKVSALYQTLAGGIATLIAGLLAVHVLAMAAGIAIVVAFFVLLALHPYRPEVVRRQREGLSVALLGLTAVGAVPLFWFALTTARLQREGHPNDPHIELAHWVTMAAMAIGIVLAGALAAMKLRGWRITAWSAGAAIFLYGLGSVIFPDLPGSEGTGWGIVAILAGLVFVAVAEWERRRLPDRSPA